jgi:hypothetical protein
MLDCWTLARPENPVVTSPRSCELSPMTFAKRFDLMVLGLLNGCLKSPVNCRHEQILRPPLLAKLWGGSTSSRARSCKA